MDLLQLDLAQTTYRALENPLRRAKWNVSPRAKGLRCTHQIVIFGRRVKDSAVNKALREDLADWQIQSVAEKSQCEFLTASGTILVLQAAYSKAAESSGHNDKLQLSDYGRMRDFVGAFWRGQKFSAKDSVLVRFDGLSPEEALGAIAGIGIASYAFAPTLKENDSKSGYALAFANNGGQLKRELIDTAQSLVGSMNLARHLANLPAACANPDDLAQFFAKYFNGRSGLTVDVWNEARIRKENMGLLLGVGQGSKWGSRFVHLRYRPKGSAKSSAKARPLAFVGKGVTFDTGGLDIKPSSGMRLMKKDMTGVAIMAALCDFVTQAGLKTPCDFYLPLAENSVSDRATRPGDVHVSRAGHFVEIDNTDAEGRLVMADAIDVAVTQAEKDAPAALFDVSTLTGAMRVAVGLDVAGFFANDDKLAREAEAAAKKMGELAWRMPLIQKYARSLNSPFADFKNSAEGGFGGAITAALFLEKFVRKTPWVHFDVMAWNNSADGALSEGSNAQCLQILIGLMLARG